MTQKEKTQLLLKDLSARQPHGVHCCVFNLNKTIKEDNDVICGIVGDNIVTLKSGKNECYMYYQIKPYLRPMSSMTEEEKHIIFELFNDKYVFVTNDGVNADNYFTPIWKPFGLQGISFKTMSKIINWLNKNMFDYRGLITMGLAIEVTKENNPYEE